MCLSAIPPACTVAALNFSSQVWIVINFFFFWFACFSKLVSVCCHILSTPGLLHFEPANKIPIQGSLGKV